MVRKADWAAFGSKQSGAASFAVHGTDDRGRRSVSDAHRDGGGENGGTLAQR